MRSTTYVLGCRVASIKFCEAHNTHHIDHTAPSLACLAFFISQLDLPISIQFLDSFCSETPNVCPRVASIYFCEAHSTHHIDHTAPSLACLAFFISQLDLPISMKCLVSFCSEANNVCTELQSYKHIVMLGTQHTAP